MKNALTAMLFLLNADAAYATEFTATVKCDARAMPPQSYVAKADWYTDAIKAAIAKGEESGLNCYSVTVTPKACPRPEYDDGTCPRSYYRHNR